MSSAGLALQQAILTALSNHAPLSTMVSAIADTPAADQALPYVQIGESVESDWSANSFSGRDHRVSLHVWSAAEGLRQTRELLALVDTAMAGLETMLDGHRVVTCHFLTSRVLVEENGLIRHGIADYRIRTQPL